jgi:hypothetical protein
MYILASATVLNHSALWITQLCLDRRISGLTKKGYLMFQARNARLQFFARVILDGQPNAIEPGPEATPSGFGSIESHSSAPQID